MKEVKKLIANFGLLIFLFPISIDVLSENILNVESATVIEGNSSNIEIQITNSDVVVGFQFDITIPNSISVDTNSVTLTGRKQDHILIVSSLGNNVLRFISYSPSQKPYLLNSGTIVTIPFLAKIGFIGGHSVILTNSILGNSSSENILTRIQNGTLTIQSANLAPIANAGKDRQFDEGAKVVLDGSASNDPNGDNITYSWTAPSGITLDSKNVAKPTFIAPEVTQNTNYTFSLIVNDGKLNSYADNVVITIKNVNKEPIANAGADQTVNEGELVTLEGTKSIDPDGDNLTFNWTAPTGIKLNSTSFIQPAFIAPSVNEDTQFSIKLVVNDGIVNSNTDEVIITVKNRTGSEDICESEIKVFPNPVKDGFYINGIKQETTIVLKDIYGHILLLRKVNQNDLILMDQIPNGIYILSIETKEGWSEKKLTIL